MVFLGVAALPFGFSLVLWLDVPSMLQISIMYFQIPPRTRIRTMSSLCYIRFAQRIVYNKYCVVYMNKYEKQSLIFL